MIEAVRVAGEQGAGVDPRPRVLVAEDNEASRAVFRRMLTGFGYEVTLVEDGAAAVQAARAQPFDLILMDGRMPVLDGYAAARQIRDAEDGDRVPIICMTASTTTADVEAAMASGMDTVLPKPMPLADLHAALETWLRP